MFVILEFFCVASMLLCAVSLKRFQGTEALFFGPEAGLRFRIRKSPKPRSVVAWITSLIHSFSSQYTPKPCSNHSCPCIKSLRLSAWGALGGGPWTFADNAAAESWARPQLRRILSVSYSFRLVSPYRPQYRYTIMCPRNPILIKT